MFDGFILKKLRELNNWTQPQLAKKLGLSTSAISMYENNQRDPDTTTLSRIADLFGVSVDHLLGKDLSKEEQTEINALKKILVKAGFMENNEEDLSEEQFDKLVSFIKANKDFIKTEKK